MTESREVCYPWHPWYGQSVVIREALVKYGTAVFRCFPAQASHPTPMEVPQWMFDRATCTAMWMAERPSVGCDDLRRLKELLRHAAGRDGGAVVENQHHSSLLEPCDSFSQRLRVTDLTPRSRAI
jgi:hypothetical protein